MVVGGGLQLPTVADLAELGCESGGGVGDESDVDGGDGGWRGVRVGLGGEKDLLWVWVWRRRHWCLSSLLSLESRSLHSTLLDYY